MFSRTKARISHVRREERTEKGRVKAAVEREEEERGKGKEGEEEKDGAWSANTPSFVLCSHGNEEKVSSDGLVSRVMFAKNTFSTFFSLSSPGKRILNVLKGHSTDEKEEGEEEDEDEDEEAEEDKEGEGKKGEKDDEEEKDEEEGEDEKE
jgi:hypothetical protein